MPCSLKIEKCLTAISAPVLTVGVVCQLATITFTEWLRNEKDFKKMFSLDNQDNLFNYTLFLINFFNTCLFLYKGVISA